MRQSKIYQNIELGINTLLLHKLRSFLTVLGVVFGVGSVIAMLAVGEGASKKALDEIRKLGSNNIIISAMKPADEQQAQNLRVRMSIYGPMRELEQRLADELARQSDDDRLVPIDRDPVPDQYADLVKRYYQELSRQP